VEVRGNEAIDFREIFLAESANGLPDRKHVSVSQLVKPLRTVSANLHESSAM
jgi:hypothetical protein